MYVILIIPEFAWEAGTVKAALPASVSEDICIIVLLLTFPFGHSYGVIVTHSPTGISWADTGKRML